MIKAPDCLLSQTLLGKYCHSSSFMECTAPSSSSHGWRGILAGREILKNGLGWVIGDGAQVPMWNAKWLSTSQPLSPIGPPSFENKNLMVKDLLLPQSNEWNIPAIQLHLPQYEEYIKKLIPSEFSMSMSSLGYQQRLAHILPSLVMLSQKSTFLHLGRALLTGISAFGMLKHLLN